MEKDKTLDRIKKALDFLIDRIRLNEVHVNSYKNKRGKIKYKGCLRAYDKKFSFEEMSLNDVDNFLSGILIGYLFCTTQYDHKK